MHNWVFLVLLKEKIYKPKNVKTKALQQHENLKNSSSDVSEVGSISQKPHNSFKYCSNKKHLEWPIKPIIRYVKNFIERPPTLLNTSRKHKKHKIPRLPQEDLHTPHKSAICTHPRRSRRRPLKTDFRSRRHQAAHII